MLYKIVSFNLTNDTREYFTITSSQRYFLRAQRRIFTERVLYNNEKKSKIFNKPFNSLTSSETSNDTSRDDLDVICQTNNGASSRADVVDRVRRVVSLRGIQIAHSSDVTDIDGTDTRVCQSDEGSARII